MSYIIKTKIPGRKNWMTIKTTKMNSKPEIESWVKAYKSIPMWKGYGFKVVKVK